MATNPHIYISSVYGTNTGATDTSQASQQTGNITSMAAGDVYDNIESAIAGCSPGDGDTVYCTNNHAASYAAATDVIINDGGTTGGTGLIIVSVDNTNVENYLQGASEDNTAGSDFLLEAVVTVYGVSFTTDDDVIRIQTQGSIVGIKDATLTSGLATDLCVALRADGAQCQLVNVDMVTTSAAGIVVDGGSTLVWQGGSTTSITDLILASGAGGGGNIFIEGVDLSSVSGNLMPTHTLTNHDSTLVVLRSCKLHASVVLPAAASQKSTNHRFEMYNCDDGTSDDYHRFYIADGSGTAQNDDGVYVNDTTTWYEGTVKSSILVNTSSTCSKLQPFIFTLPAQYIDLSQAASDVVTLDFVVAGGSWTPTDTEIAAYLVYPDGTTAVTPRWIADGKTVGAGNLGIDPLAAGSTIASSSLAAGDWTGEPASPGFYKFEFDTSSVAGQATAVAIRVEVYEPSQTMYLHPLITAS